ncbi:acyltransferase family protein [Colwellia sp. RE-S-Sl-9]
MQKKNLNAQTFRMRDINLDAVKGLLILFIVIEHNSLLTDNYLWIRPFSDAFAAACFLTFTFIWPIKNTVSFTAYCDKHFSYWWPFFLFVTFTSILNLFFYNVNSIDFFSIQYLKALFISSPSDIKVASGFMYFWFIPCLCALYVLRFFEQKVGSYSFFITIPLWATIGLIDENILINIPFSLHVIAFIFFLGQLYSRLNGFLLLRNNKVKYIIVIIFLGFSIATPFVGWELFLAAGVIPSFKEPLLLLFYSIFILIAIPGLYHLTYMLPKFLVKFFSYLGGISLTIYLIHPILYILMTQILKLINHPELSFLITISGCLIIGYTIEQTSTFKKVLFPKTLSSLSKIGKYK